MNASDWAMLVFEAFVVKEMLPRQLQNYRQATKHRILREAPRNHAMGREIRSPASVELVAMHSGTCWKHRLRFLFWYGGRAMTRSQVTPSTRAGTRT